MIPYVDHVLVVVRYTIGHGNHVLLFNSIQFNSVQNSLFSTEHIVHTITFCTGLVEKGASRTHIYCVGSFPFDVLYHFER